MPEQPVQGPIADAIRAKIAKIIDDPTNFIAFVKMLIAIMPKKSDEAVFASAEENAALAELVELCHQAENGS